MIDIKEIEKNYEEVKNNLARRGYVLDEQIIQMYKKIKTLNMRMEEINTLLNQGKGTKELKDEFAQLKNEKNTIETVYLEKYHMIPNVLCDTVPNGEGAEDNVELKVVGEKVKANKGYMDIAKNNGLNIEAGVDLAHARFNVMHGNVAKLHRKLINKALDVYEKNGYEFHYVPDMVNEKTMFGTGQFPKFKDDLFKTEDGLYLIPTGEVPLTNLVNNQIIEEERVERKLMTHTPCFRKEVGAYGKDTKGIIRQHQFEKVELVRVCLPENGLKNFNEMVNDIEVFVKELGLTYRIIELCAKDIGFSGHKAYDFEVWFPYEQAWREIATVTWCFDFQARRMNAKLKRKDKKKEFVHTLNGTGLAVGRVMACLIETFGEDAFK